VSAAKFPVKVDKFYAHLDACAQCREHPFDLCGAGSNLLREAATGLPPRPPSQPNLQSIPIGTELGKQIRQALARSFSEEE